MFFLENNRKNGLYRVFSVFLVFAFIFTSIIPPSYGQNAPQTILNLPIPGAFVSSTDVFYPAMVKGITLHPENPLRFDFVVDTGATGMKRADVLNAEITKLVKYFLASLTVPEKEMWVNLSPDEPDRIIAEGLGRTDMGRDMLGQDYMLKQLTASLMHPEEDLGQEFWNRVYARAQAEYGTTDIPMDTFHKVWIVPEKAVVYEHEETATTYVLESRLKVMLEEDYLAASNNVGANPRIRPNQGRKQGFAPTTSIIREILIPEIQREVNEGSTFANLRQIYHSMILAAWYKRSLKQSLLGQVYVDQNKTKGITTEDEHVTQKIYDQYIESFKKGVYDYIKEDYDPTTNQIIPRKYFSGGFAADFSILRALKSSITRIAPTQIFSDEDNAILSAQFDLASLGKKTDLSFLDSAMKTEREALKKALRKKVVQNFKGLQGKGHINILWVEDDEELTDAYKKELENDKYKIEWIKSGEDAWQYVRNNYAEIDLIITDLDLDGEMSGSDLIDELNNEKNNEVSIIPILILTAGQAVGALRGPLKRATNNFIEIFRKVGRISEYIAKVKNFIENPPDDLSMMVRGGNKGGGIDFFKVSGEVRKKIYQLKNQYADTTDYTITQGTFGYSRKENSNKSFVAITPDDSGNSLIYVQQERGRKVFVFQGRVPSESGLSAWEPEGRQIQSVKEVEIALEDFIRGRKSKLAEEKLKTEAREKELDALAREERIQDKQDNPLASVAEIFTEMNPTKKEHKYTVITVKGEVSYEGFVYEKKPYPGADEMYYGLVAYQYYDEIYIKKGYIKKRFFNELGPEADPYYSLFPHENLTEKVYWALDNIDQQKVQGIIKEFIEEQDVLRNQPEKEIEFVKIQPSNEKREKKVRNVKGDVPKKKIVNMNKIKKDLEAGRIAEVLQDFKEDEFYAIKGFFIDEKDRDENASSVGNSIGWLFVYFLEYLRNEYAGFEYPKYIKIGYNLNKVSGDDESSFMSEFYEGVEEYLEKYKAPLQKSNFLDKNPLGDRKKYALADNHPYINIRKYFQFVDEAMLNIDDKKSLGGINLDAAMLDLQVRRDGNGVPLPFSLQPADLGMRVQGFYPILNSVTPVTLLQLGLNSPVGAPPPEDASSAKDASTFLDLSYSFTTKTRDPWDRVIFYV